MKHSVAPSNPDGELEELEELGQVEEVEAAVVQTAVEDAAVAGHTEAGNQPHTEAGNPPHTEAENPPHTEAGNPPHTEDSMVEAHTAQEAHTHVRMIFPEIGSQRHAPVQM